METPAATELALFSGEEIASPDSTGNPTPEQAATARIGFDRDIRRAGEHYAGSWASATLRAYRSDLKDFAAYCESRGLSSIPASPETICAYLAALGDGDWGAPRKLATIERRKASLSHVHKEAGLGDPASDPRVLRVLKGIRREKSVKQERKDALRTEDIQKIVKTFACNPRGLRDKALLLIGFATGCRGSELAALQFKDIQSHRQGLIIEIRRSKTDQDGEGHIKLIRCGRKSETCPVRALKAWMDSGAIETGSVFRSITNAEEILDEAMSNKGVSRAIKRAVAAIGLNPDHYASHSLRAGFVTEADSRGAKTSDIMRQSAHKTARMIAVYTRYNLDEVFRDSTALDLGL
ncbi:site-specific integrase [bacterium]|nr:site-specific integrase [bacterium]